MYALVGINDLPLRVNLKCDPEKAIELREEFSSVLPGYHMNKAHWNTVVLDGTIHTSTIKEWIDDSYDLIVNSLPKAKRDKVLNRDK